MPLVLAAREVPAFPLRPAGDDDRAPAPGERARQGRGRARLSSRSSTRSASRHLVARAAQLGHRGSAHGDAYACGGPAVHRQVAPGPTKQKASSTRPGEEAWCRARVCLKVSRESPLHRGWNKTTTSPVRQPADAERPAASPGRHKDREQVDGGVGHGKEVGRRYQSGPRTVKAAESSRAQRGVVSQPGLLGISRAESWLVGRAVRPL